MNGAKSFFYLLFKLLCVLLAGGHNLQHTHKALCEEIRMNVIFQLGGKYIVKGDFEGMTMSPRRTSALVCCQ